jgi:hypothetical protein
MPQKIIYYHIWSSYMILHDDHAWWSYMIIIHDDHIWSSYIIIMMIIHDHHIWCSYMIIMYDDHIWSSYMIIIYDYHIWWSYMMNMLMEFLKSWLFPNNDWGHLGYVLGSSLVSRNLSGSSKDQHFLNISKTRGRTWMSFSTDQIIQKSHLEAVYPLSHFLFKSHFTEEVNVYKAVLEKTQYEEYSLQHGPDGIINL